MSHPARGAWIEIVYFDVDYLGSIRRTPQGVRGLKYYYITTIRVKLQCVAPRKGCVD